MKRAQWTDFFREIKKSKNRYISILLIVALGVAFYTGVRSSEPDMQLSADALYDDTNLMDIRVIGTLGLTKEDRDKIAQIDGITTVEGGYTTETLCMANAKEYVLQVNSMLDEINQFYITEGRLPETEEECFIDEIFMESSGYQIGDMITLTSGNKKELEDVLKKDTYKIVGYGTYPYYLTWNRGTASIGNGTTDAFLFIKPQNFIQEAYSVIYATVDSADYLNSYTTQYKEVIEQITDEIDNIAHGQCEIRYQDIMAEAKEAISEAKEEIQNGEQELSDVQKEMAEAKKKIEKNKERLKRESKKLLAAKQDVKQGQQELQDGQQKWQDGQTAIREAEIQLEDQETKLLLSETELLEKDKIVKMELENLEQNRQTLQIEEQNLKENEQLLRIEEQNLKSKEQLLQVKEKNLKEQEQTIQMEEDNLKKQEQVLQNHAKKLELKEIQLKLQEQVLQQQRNQLQEKERTFKDGLIEEELKRELEQTRQQLQQTDEQIIQAKQELEVGKQQLEEGKTKLIGGKQQIAEGKLAIEAGKREILSAKQVIKVGRQQIEQNKQDIIKGKQELISAKEALEAGRTELNSASQSIETGRNQIADGKNNILAGKRTITEKKEILTTNRQTILQSEQQLEEAVQKITDGEKELLDGVEKIKKAQADLKEGREKFKVEKVDAQKKLKEGKEELAKAEEDLAQLKLPEWYVLDRNSIQTFVELGLDAERIGAIGRVFPVIFFLVAALVSLTTMTRMVEEERTQIGTLKALGYSKISIASKYLLYALSATLVGGMLGVIIGSNIFPYIVIKAYGILYIHLNTMVIPINWNISFLSIAIAVFCTVFATLLACYKELASCPATLMRPAVPIKGKRVLLERIPFIWNRLNFTKKSTMRNLLRYKKRFFMTVFGIASCMALLMVGFGLRDSIQEIVNRQYKTIWTYNASLMLEDNIQHKENLAKKLIKSHKEIKQSLFVKEVAMDIEKDSITKNAYLFVPETIENLEQFVVLKNRVNQETYQLSDEGVIISEKLASMLNASVGDTIFLKESETKTYPVVIIAIAENYLYHYVYMTTNLYESIFQEPPSYNELFLKMDRLEEQEKIVLEEQILQYEEIKSISVTKELEIKVNDMMKSLDLVIWLLIISAGLLAFIVLYNLNNINIVERKRELATIKVLGFYNMELAEYVYRENIFLTLFGILMGIIIGFFLHRFVIQTCEIDMIMFGRQIKGLSYLYSILLTIFFSLFVNVTMFFKLKKIDMVESLKSVE